MRGLLIAFGVFLLWVVLTVVCFSIWLEHWDPFSSSSASAWDLFLLFAFLSAIAALGAFLVLTALVTGSLMRLWKRRNVQSA